MHEILRIFYSVTARQIGILFFTVLFGMNIHSNAQCCSGGVPISGSLGLSTSNAKTLSFQLTYDYNVLHSLFEGKMSLKDNTRERKTHSILLETNYGITDWLSVTGMVSFVRQERIVNTIANQTDFTKTNGFGDGILLLKFTLINPEKTPDYRLSIGLGPKFPFGKTTFTNNLGLRLSADLQPGTGAWDMLLWSNFERFNLFTQNFNINVQLTYRLTGKNKKYFGTQEYKFGNELALNFQMNYRFFVKSQIFDAIVGLRYRNQTIDIVDGEEFPNSGGNFIFIEPGFSYSINPDVAFRFSTSFPIYRNVGGTQVTSSYKLIASIFYRLKLKNKKENLFHNIDKNI